MNLMPLICPEGSIDCSGGIQIGVEAALHRRPGEKARADRGGVTSPSAMLREYSFLGINAVDKSRGVQWRWRWFSLRKGEVCRGKKGEYDYG